MHKDCNQAVKSGTCLVVDGGYATRDAGAKKPRWPSRNEKILSQFYSTESLTTFNQAYQPA